MIDSQTLPGETKNIGIPLPSQGMIHHVVLSSSTILAEFSKVSHLLSERELRRPRRCAPAGQALKLIARKNPPPAEWFEGEEERPF